MFKEVGNPLGIFLVGFLAFNGANIFGMSQDHMPMVFENVEDGIPVFSGGFHANMVTMVGQKPIAKRIEVIVESGKGFLKIGCDVLLVCGSDGSNNRPLVHIDATADGVDNSQTNHPLANRMEAVAVTGVSAKTFDSVLSKLSVRAQSPTNLCLRRCRHI